MLSASDKSKVYWQAKIWGILHDPILKALHNNTGRGGNSFWQQLDVMQDWVENGWNPEEKQGKLLKQIKLADFIASASDRGAIGSITDSVNYNQNGLEIKHLLSGATFDFKISQHDTLVSNRLEYLTQNRKPTPRLNSSSYSSTTRSRFFGGCGDVYRKLYLSNSMTKA